MHIEILVEDSSGMTLLGHLLPKLIGEHRPDVTYRLHPYKGIGHLPKNLKGTGDARKRVLLDRLPQLLRGYAKTPAVQAVVVVLDVDKNDSTMFLRQLKEVALTAMLPETLFGLAVEEIEAWYLGDSVALLAAYPKAKKLILGRYCQDGICHTWELLADAIHPGGAAATKSGGPHAGDLKHEWAKTIGPRMDVEANVSPSFKKFRDGFRQVCKVPVL